MSKLSRCFFSL